MSKLFVGNLSFNASEEELKRIFEQDGRNVARVSIVTDRDTGQSRGFGFIEMGSPADAEAAIAALDGYELDGRRLRVSEARERAPRGPGGGGGGPRGGGGRGGPRGGRDGGRGGGRGGRF
jgi:RNA recognition motif-containing protein